MTESAERHARAQKLGGSMLQDSAIEFNDMPNVQVPSPRSFRFWCSTALDSNFVHCSLRRNVVDPSRLQAA
jgi:hypothetical protein